MKPSHWLALARGALLAALLASSALYVHYLDPLDSGFCGGESGCEAIRRMGLLGQSYFFGSRFVSIPLVGLLAFGTLFLVSFRPDRDRLPLLALASAGALGGLGLFLYQAVAIGSFCWLCVAADGGAVAAGAFVLLYHRARPLPLPAPGGDSGAGADGPSRGLLEPWAWTALAVAVVAAPVLWAQVKPAPPVPSVIRGLYEPGKINVVVFADFQCPFCRSLHPELTRVLDDYPAEALNLVHLNAPLPHHPLARPAARAVVCADAQGKGHAMIDTLMTATLEASTMRRAAVDLGLDVEGFDTCVGAEATDERIERDMAILQESGFTGLPTLYIGAKRFVGVPPEPALRDALDRARRGDGDTGVPAPVFAGTMALLLAGVAWRGRAR